MMFPAVFFSRAVSATRRFSIKTPVFFLASCGFVLLATGCADSSGSDSGGSVNNHLNP